MLGGGCRTSEIELLRFTQWVMSALRLAEREKLLYNYGDMFCLLI